MFWRIDKTKTKKMNKNEGLVELTAEESVKIMGGGNDASTLPAAFQSAGAAAFKSAATATVSSVVGQAVSMQAAGYTMTIAEATSAAVTAISSPVVLTAAGVAADAVLVDAAAQQGNQALSAVASLAQSYENSGYSAFSAWCSAIGGSLWGTNNSDFTGQVST